MKKLGDLIRPFLSVIFGALLLLFYLNWLQYKGAGLAVGIIAVILASYYLCIGILGTLVKFNDKAKNIFDILSISLFALFEFVYFLITIINGASSLGPNGWVINILSLVASLMLAMLFALARFSGNGMLGKLAAMFAAMFIGALVLNIVFDPLGNPNDLGDVNIVNFAIDACFVSMLLPALGALNKTPEQSEPKEVEQKEE